MAFQAVPDTAEVTIIYNQNTEAITNTFAARLIGGYTLADLDILATEVDQNMPGNLLGRMTLDCLYVRTEVRGLAFENDIETLAQANSGVGLSTSEGLPNNVTLSIKKSSAFTGRSARGRWYFIGIPSNNLAGNENTYSQVEVDGMVTAIESLRAQVATTVWIPVIVSRFNNGVLRNPGKTFDWIATSAVNPFVDSQRGRLTR